jgi:WD40 repeat protein
MGDLAFGPKGEWLATAGLERAELRFHDGREPIDVGHYLRTGDWLEVAFGGADLLVTGQGGNLRWWSVPEGEELRRAEGDRGWLAFPRGEGYFSFAAEEGRETIHWWPFAEGGSRLVGSMTGISAADIDPSGVWLAFSREQTVYMRSLEDWSRPPRMLGKHSDGVAELTFHPGGERVAARDRSGEIRVWPTTDNAAEPLRILQVGDLRKIRYDPSGRWLAAQGVVEGSPTVGLWDLAAPIGVEPLTLQRTDDVFANRLAFHPTKPWLVTTNLNSAGFWPLANGYPWAIAGHAGWVSDLVFTPDGNWLVSAAEDGVRAWPLAGQNQGASRVLFQGRLRFADIDIPPASTWRWRRRTARCWSSPWPEVPCRS